MDGQRKIIMHPPVSLDGRGIMTIDNDMYDATVTQKVLLTTTTC